METANGSSGLAVLRRRWVQLSLAAATTVAGCLLLLEGVLGLPEAIRWGFASGVTLAYLLWLLWRNLPLNRRHGETGILPTLGAGTGLSLLRGLCIALLAGFLTLPRPLGLIAWAPAILYTVGDLTDYFDGYLARLQNHVTLLGERLDLELDALGLLAATLLAIHYGSLPWWFLILGLARYAFVAGLWLLERRGSTIQPLPPSGRRRAVAGLTMGFMSAMLWPIVKPPATTLAGILFGAPFLAGFVRDWLVVSGALDPASPQYQRARSVVLNFMIRIFPVLLRLGTVLTLVALLGRALLDTDAWVAAFQSQGYRWPSLTAWAFAAVELAALVLLLLGVAGRFASFALIVVLGFTIVGLGYDPVHGAALGGAISLLILGTGAFSLWEPERAIFGRPRGSPP